MTVPYSEEFRVRETNQALIEALANVEPRGGEVGQVTAPLLDQPSEDLIDSNAFRGGLALAKSIRDAWPWFVLGGCCLFLGDVFVRRVAINFDWIGASLKQPARRVGRKGLSGHGATRCLEEEQRSTRRLTGATSRERAI